MTEKTRVLIFTTAFRPFIGGSEIALEENIRHLPEVFFDVYTPRYSRGLSSLECSANYCIHRVGLGFGGDKYIFPKTGLLASLKVLKKTDILHAYQASFGGLAALAAKLIYPGKKLIITLQEGKELDKQNFIIKTMRSMILKKADVITVISSYLRDFAEGINKKAQIVLVPNGVDLNRFKADGVKDKHLFVTVSRLVPKNGLRYLVDAMPEITRQFPSARLQIIGSGPEDQLLKQLADDLNLKNSVEFVGEVPYAEIPEYLAKASMFIRPSLSEGLGSAFLEAMASGCAVVGTSVGGIPDFLKDRETGLFCKLGNSRSIAGSIIELLRDDELRTRLAQNGRKLVEEKYDWNLIASKFKNIYAGI